MRFTKGTGLTASEKLLADLCERSFLSLWSYPNLFYKPGKELSDLMVVFGNDVIVFSDKSCAYPDSGNPALDWDRWYRRSITDSARQINRAEGWLRGSPDRIFLDAKCAKPVPVPLPAAERLRVFRVCIALGSSARALAEKGKRDLTVSALIEGDAERFTVGRIAGAKGLVHVFDENTLPVVLSELSTTADFLDYLRKKEALFASGRFTFAESELDLLGYFLWNGREFVDHGAARFRLNPKLWEQVEADPQFLAAREENKVGYFWDGLIEYLTKLYMMEQLEHGNDMPIADHERLVRIMAAETRFSRRVLAKWVLERAERGKEGYVGSLLPSMQDGVLYVLLIGPGDGGKDHTEYRTARAEQLYARCIAAKAAQRDRSVIVGIAMDARGVKGSSEDFIYLNTEGWTNDAIQKAEKLRQELRYFVDGKGQPYRIDEAEYPGTWGCTNGRGRRRPWSPVRETLEGFLHSVSRGGQDS
jgi:hypothetical protein